MTDQELQTQVAQLQQVASQLHSDEDALDELVHETAQEVGLDTLNTLAADAAQDAHITTIEQAASEINNGGFETQLVYLLAARVSPETIREHLQAAGPQSRFLP